MRIALTRGFFVFSLYLAISLSAVGGAFARSNSMTVEDVIVLLKLGYGEKEILSEI